MIKSVLQSVRGQQPSSSKKAQNSAAGTSRGGFGYYRIIHGYRGHYLGYVPATRSAANGKYYVDKILDRCNINEAQVVDVYVEVCSNSVNLYNAASVVDNDNYTTPGQGYATYGEDKGEINASFTDVIEPSDSHTGNGTNCSSSSSSSSTQLAPPVKVTPGMRFDVTRISCCLGCSGGDGRILSWIYRQETADGFQMECHAVRFPTARRANTVARLLYESFSKLFLDVRQALRTSKVFYSAVTCQQSAQASHLQQRSERIVHTVTNGDDIVCQPADSSTKTSSDSAGDSANNDDSVFESVSEPGSSEAAAGSEVERCVLMEIRISS